MDYKERLPDLTMPTLLCVGRHDPQTPVACSQELAEGIPRTRLVVVFEQSGHFPFLEEPDRFVAEITCFLNEIKTGENK